MSEPKLLQMVEIRDLRKGDRLVTSNPFQTLVVNGGDNEWDEDELYWWAGSTFYLHVREETPGRIKELGPVSKCFDLQIDGDETMKVGVWR